MGSWIPPPRIAGGTVMSPGQIPGLSPLGGGVPGASWQEIHHIQTPTDWCRVCLVLTSRWKATGTADMANVTDVEGLFNTICQAEKPM
eukprot:10606016-Ditylum_brightwellii.AAC.1